LLLQNESIELSPEMLDYTMEKIKWLIPFHLQLIQQEIVDVHESSNKEIDKLAIDKAFDQVVHVRNKPQFQPYFSRLKKIFKDEEYAFVMEVLEYIAQEDSIENNILHDLSVKHNVTDYKLVMDMLEGDGYLFLTDKKYQYTSPILQLWCKKHICK
jgi:hypothetical protein